MRYISERILHHPINYLSHVHCSYGLLVIQWLLFQMGIRNIYIDYRGRDLTGGTMPASSVKVSFVCTASSCLFNSFSLEPTKSPSMSNSSSIDSSESLTELILLTLKCFHFDNMPTANGAVTITKTKQKTNIVDFEMLSLRRYACS